jgi:hypothetical protein
MMSACCASCAQAALMDDTAADPGFGELGPAGEFEMRSPSLEQVASLAVIALAALSLWRVLREG